VETLLKYEKLPEKLLEPVVAEIFASISLLLCRHLCVFSIALATETQIHPIDDRMIQMLDAAEGDPKLLAEIGEVLARLAAEASDDEDFKQRIAEFVKSYEAEASVIPSGFLKPILITRPVSWEQFSIQCAEHFGDVWIAATPAPPDDWNWLTEKGEYLIAFPISAVVSQPFAKGEYLLRQLTSVAECLRSQQVQDKDDASETTRARCKILSIRLSDCYYDRKPLRLYDFSRLRTLRDEFEMNSLPFTHLKDMYEREKDGINKAFQWLTHCPKERPPLRKAVECFESAISLGGSRRAISPEMESLWTIVAFWSSLEVLAQPQQGEKKLSHVLDFVNKKLKAAGIEESQIALAGNCLRTMYDRRNDAVHRADVQMEFEDVMKFRRVVASVLGHEIRTWLRGIRVVDT
jgi:hypothetical protein